MRAWHIPTSCIRMGERMKMEEIEEIAKEKELSVVDVAFLLLDSDMHLPELISWEELKKRLGALE